MSIFEKINFMYYGEPVGCALGVEMALGDPIKGSHPEKSYFSLILLHFSTFVLGPIVWVQIFFCKSSPYFNYSIFLQLAHYFQLASYHLFISQGMLACPELLNEISTLDYNPQLTGRIVALFNLLFILIKSLSRYMFNTISWKKHVSL